MWAHYIGRDNLAYDGASCKERGLNAQEACMAEQRLDTQVQALMYMQLTGARKAEEKGMPIIKR